MSSTERAIVAAAVAKLTPAEKDLILCDLLACLRQDRLRDTKVASLPAVPVWASLDPLKKAALAVSFVDLPLADERPGTPRHHR